MVAEREVFNFFYDLNFKSHKLFFVLLSKHKFLTMKNIILPIALSLFLCSCADEKKVEETPAEPNGINISVKDDSTNANININENGIDIKSKDGEEAHVNIGKEGVDIVTDNGEKANIKITEEGMNIKSKDGEANVKMDKSGNMNIKTPDGKEINVNVKDAMDKK